MRFLVTQKTAANPYALPFAITPDGQMSILTNIEGNYIFRPTYQADYSQSKNNYSHPVRLNSFDFYPQQPEIGFVEVKRRRMEGGLGLSAIMKEMVTIGLIPYKGSMQTLITHKNTRKEKSHPLSLPKKLDALKKWSTNDEGTFQTYGGVTLYAGVSNGLIDFGLGSIGIQNQFIVELKKMSEDLVRVTITEENLKRRQILVGAAFIEGSLAQFSGKRLSAEFTLDLDQDEHHTLYREALRGNIKHLQERLDTSLQKLSWSGSDRTFYYGIPTIIGKVRNAGHYDLLEDGEGTELNFTGSNNRGVFTPVRNLQDLVYQTDQALVVVWTSEMSSMTRKAFVKRFLSVGKAMGLKDFNREAPEGSFGSVVAHIAAHFSRKEIESISESDLVNIYGHLKNVCEAQKLSCRKESRLKSIIKYFSSLKKKSWDDMRADLGLFFMKEPALIQAVVKAMNYKKEVYFKFLSEKYQSLEGTSPIVI